MDTLLNIVPIAILVGSLIFLTISIFYARPSRRAAGLTAEATQTDKQQIPAVLGVVALIALLAFLPATVAGFRRASDARLRSQLEQARAEAQQLSAQLASTQSELSTARQDAAEAQTRLAEVQRALAMGAQQNRDLTAEVQSLTSSLEGFQSLRSSLDFQANVKPDPFLSNIEIPSVRAALEQTFELREQRVAFTWRGRDPQTGLDSFGFVREVLRSGGVDIAARVTDLAKAELLFRRVDKPRPGDILVFRGDHAMIYLGQNRTIGMTPLGIAIQKLDLAPRPLLILRVPYPTR